MQGRTFECSIEFGAHRLDSAVLTCLSGGSTDHWSIDVPSVIWVLERIAAGEADAAQAAEELRKATTLASGCCNDCELAAPHYADARARYEQEILPAWERAQHDPGCADGAYLLNKGKIHKSTCRRPAAPTPPAFPADLHTFAGHLDAYGSVTALLAALGEADSRQPQRIGDTQVLLMIARDGLAAVRARLCGSCKPPLPATSLPDAMVTPACWRWVTDRETLDGLRAQAATSTDPPSHVLPEHHIAFELLRLWQDGRCAVCGVTAANRLVRDHDHASGLLRGLLCSACNTAEGRSDSPLFENYRRRPPVDLLSVEVLYLPLGFRPGIRHLAGNAGATAPFWPARRRSST